MRKVVFVFSLLALLAYWSGCKKCYNCHNTCVLCALTASGHTFTQVICNDSFTIPASYNAAITADTAQGWICTASSSTYSYNFCTDKPGQNNNYYINYFDEGGRATCVQK